MAQNIKAYTIELKADLEPLLNSVDKLEQKFEQLGDKLKNAFSGSGAEQAIQEINRLLEDQARILESNGASQIDQLRRNADEALRNENRSLQERLAAQERYANDLQRLTRETQQNVRNTRNQQTQASNREMREAQRDLERTTGEHRFSIIELETEGPIEEMRDLARSLTTTNRQLQEEINRQYRAMSTNNVDEIRQAEAKMISILERSSNERVQQIRQNVDRIQGLRERGFNQQIQDQRQSEERLLRNSNLTAEERARITRDGAAQRERIEREYQQQRQRIAEQGNQAILREQRENAARQEAVRRTSQNQQEAAPNRRLAGRLQNTPIFEEMGSAAEGLSGRLGVLGNVATKLGPVGIAVGAIGGSLLAAGSAAAAANDKFEQFNRAALGIKQTGDLTAEEFEKVKTQLLALPRPAEVSAVELAKAAEAVASFESPENIAKTTAQLLQLQKIGGGEIGLNEISAGAGRLSTALGDTNLAMDLLAQTAQSLKGKSVDPMGDAITEIGTIFSKATLAITDTEQAAKESGAVFTALAKSGFEVSEATTAANLCCPSRRAPSLENLMASPLRTHSPRSIAFARETTSDLLLSGLLLVFFDKNCLAIAGVIFST